MKLFKDEWYEIGDRIVRVAREITIELSPNIQEIRVYPTLIQSNKLIQGQTDTCIISFYGNPSDITPINFWDLGSKIPWSAFQQLIMRYYNHEEILLEAKRRFPIGTKYYPAHLNNANVESDANFIVGQDQSFILDHHSLDVELQNPNKSYFSRDRNGHAYNQVLFDQGRWARILSKPSNNQSMTRQEALLAEAISKYPIGTQYIPLATSGKAYSIDDIAEVVRTPNGNSDLLEGGLGYLYVRGKWAEIVTVKTNLLQEAKRRYPIGTQVKSLFHKGNPILTIKSDDFSSVRKDAIHVHSDRTLAAVVYENGEWAEIVKPSESSIDYDAILAEAIRRYPIGTNYYPLNGRANKSDRITTSVKEAVWFEKKVNNSSRNPQDLIEIGNGYVYVDGKWAEIAENNIDYDAVLEIAKRKYPKGTKYMPLSSQGNLYTSAKISDKEAHWYDRRSRGQAKDRIEIGYGFAYIDGKWAEVIEEASPKNSFPSEAEVLRRYPKGTWYLPIFANGAVGEVPKQSEESYGGGDDYLWVSTEIGTGYVYDGRNQKWADVVPNPNSDFRELSEKELIAEAYRRYPIGTKFKSPDDKGAIREVKPYGNNSTVIWALDRHKKLRTDNGMFNDIFDDRGRKTFCSNPHIYHEGVWAEIVQETSMPGYPVTTQDAYFPTEKLVARKEVLTKQSASQHKVEELPLLKIKKF